MLNFLKRCITSIRRFFDQPAVMEVLCKIKPFVERFFRFLEARRAGHHSGPSAPLGHA